jgi:hypothetical protein
VVPELASVAQGQLDDALPARHRFRQRIISDQLDLGAQREHPAVTHAGIIVRGGEGDGSIEQHDGAHVLHADVGHGAVVHGVGALMRDAHDELLDVLGSHMMLADEVEQRVERRLDRRADRPALDIGVHDLVGGAELAHELQRIGRATIGDEEAALACENILHGTEAVRNHSGRGHAVARRHAAEVECFFDVFLVAHPARDA